MSELDWAAGLFEGEGCISIVRNTKSKFKLHAKLFLQMNDKSVVDKFASIFKDQGKIYCRPPRGASKQSWAWTVYTRKDVRSIINQLYPLLSDRRQSKCREALELMDRQDGGSCGV